MNGFLREDIFHSGGNAVGEQLRCDVCDPKVCRDCGRRMSWKADGETWSVRKFILEYCWPEIH